MVIEANNALYQLHRAVDALATGTGTIQERLVIAYTPMLQALRPETVPDDVREDLKHVQSAISAAMHVSDKDARGDATVSKMSDEQAAKLAETIVEMFLKVALRDPDGNYHKRPDSGLRVSR